jgi:hypothetical protein
MDQQQQPPAYHPPAGQPVATVAASNNTRKIAALWLLIGPTALIVVSIVLYAIVNFATAGSPSPAFSSIVNVILFLVGAISTLTWLPGIIIGIVLLTTQKKS